VDAQTRDYLEARWEARLAKLPPELAERIRNAPPPTEEEKAVIAAALRPRPARDAAA
jgi:hypothetical protein